MNPAAPVVGVGGVLVHEGRVLLIRRGKEPLYGRWVVPGGTVELGEPLELLTVFDRIQRDGGQVLYHYVIVDYLCEHVSGEVRAGSDAAEVALVSEADLPAFDLPDKAMEVVLEGFRREAMTGLPAVPARSRILK